MNIFQILTQAPHVTPNMLYADYWLNRSEHNVDALMVSPNDIALFNRRVHQRLEIPDLFDLPDSMSSRDIHDLIHQYRIPKAPHFDGSGEVISQAVYDAMIANAEGNLSKQNPIQYGLVTQRTSVRRFPTDTIVTDEPLVHHQDWFQETTVDVGWGVAVLSTSQDGQWYFCLTPLYWGWVPRQAVALASRNDTQAFLGTPDYVVTRSAQGLVALQGGGGISPQTGTRLPLIDETNDMWVVDVPQQSDGEMLAFTEGYIRKNDTPISQFGVGDLDHTQRNLVNIAFGILGERYAWGGSRVGIFGRDCSRFAKDVFATTGMVLGRNGDEQERSGTPIIQFTPEMNDDERCALIIKHGRIGDLLYTRGHVMLYIGHQDGDPYIIHDVGGDYQAVIVSTLVLDETKLDQSILRRLTSLTRMSL